jgi:hypothetical protein
LCRRDVQKSKQKCQSIWASFHSLRSWRFVFMFPPLEALRRKSPHSWALLPIRDSIH